MSKIIGKYTHDKNENIDEYFRVVGVPFMGRKMMAMTRPSLEISQDNDEWIITTSTLLRTVTLKFKLGQEYEERMPGQVIKSTTTLEDDKLKTISIAPNGEKVFRVYETTEKGCVIIYKHEKSGIEARRYFNRA